MGYDNQRNVFYLKESRFEEDGTDGEDGDYGEDSSKYSWFLLQFDKLDFLAKTELIGMLNQRMEPYVNAAAFYTKSRYGVELDELKGVTSPSASPMKAKSERASATKAKAVIKAAADEEASSDIVTPPKKGKKKGASPATPPTLAAPAATVAPPAPATTAAPDATPAPAAPAATAATADA